MFKVRSDIEEKNDLFLRCIQDGVLIIEDSTKNRYVHGRTERVCFRAWFCRVIGLS